MKPFNSASEPNKYFQIQNVNKKGYRMKVKHKRNKN